MAQTTMIYSVLVAAALYQFTTEHCFCHNQWTDMDISLAAKSIVGLNLLSVCLISSPTSSPPFQDPTQEAFAYEVSYINIPN